MRPRRPDGKFDKGQPPPTSRRAKGTPNKLTKTIKEAMTEAGEKTGSDGKGKDEIVGVFQAVAKKDIVAFGNMLTRMVPLEVAAEVNNVSTPKMQVNIITIPSGWALGPRYELYPPEEIDAAWELFHRGQPYPPPSREPPSASLEPYRCSDPLQVEPEVAALMQRIGKRKPDDDEPA